MKIEVWRGSGHLLGASGRQQASQTLPRRLVDGFAEPLGSISARFYCDLIHLGWHFLAIFIRSYLRKVDLWTLNFHRALSKNIGVLAFRLFYHKIPSQCDFSANMAPCWRQHGPMLAQKNRLDASWAVLEASWAVLPRTRGVLGGRSPPSTASGLILEASGRGLRRQVDLLVATSCWNGSRAGGFGGVLLQSSRLRGLQAKRHPG